SPNDGRLFLVNLINSNTNKGNAKFYTNNGDLLWRAYGESNVDLLVGNGNFTWKSLNGNGDVLFESNSGGFTFRNLNGSKNVTFETPAGNFNFTSSGLSNINFQA